MTSDGAFAGLAAGAALLVAADARAVARGRLHRTSPPADTVRVGRQRASAAATAVLVAVLLVGATNVVGTAAVLLGGVVSLPVAGLRWLRTRAQRRREADLIGEELPRVADLLATCLHAGIAPVAALDMVRAHLPGPVSDRIAPVAGALRVGVDPLLGYGDHQGCDDPVRSLVRAFARAMETGAPLADILAAVGDDQRRRRRWAAEAAARKAGVHAVGPLVLCHLPAFVLLGIVPTVAGTALTVLKDLS